MHELAREQTQLDRLFDRRDELLERAGADLTEARTAGDPVGAEVATRRVNALEAASRRLCFGRLDLADGGRHYIGRVGLPAEDEDADPLLIDWRAPIASAFYTATGRAPGQVTRRRHLQTDGRVVTGISDEVLTDADDDDDVVGEAALLAALNDRRTGHMQDVVATIQAEQDAIIRADHRRPMVVQGGPGTGKTAVALHRAAYLLFSSPHLAERGVLVLGPSRAFLDYIDQVLPALGETQVAATSIDDLLPGVQVTETDDPAVAALKSGHDWPKRLARLVADQRHLDRPVGITVAGDEITVAPTDLTRLAQRALSTRKAHNDAREVFGSLLRDLLVQRCGELGAQGLSDVEHGLEEVLGTLDAAIDRDLSGYAVRGTTGTEVDGAMSATELRGLRSSLDDDPAVEDLVERIWPRLKAIRLLRDLLADPTGFDPELPVQLRTRRAGWSSADIALLDELAELVGGDRPPAAEGSLAERALADRTWTYGHAVVDEAQELTPMQWRMVLRRCPTRSLTIVGDVDQTSSPGGASDWREALGRHLEDRWRLEELTINYRTPRQVMELAEEVRSRIGSSVRPARALRDGVAPRRITASSGPEAAQTVRDEVGRLATAYDGGSVAVIAPQARIDELADAAEGAMTITPATAKGLEFDAVVLVDSAAIEAEPRGAGSLYVAMTRCTQELVLVDIT